MKKTTIVWSIMMIIIFSMLTFIGFQIKNRKIKDIREDAILIEAEKYLNLNVGKFPSKGNVTRIDLGELIEAGFDPQIDDDCDGYVLVKGANIGFTYKPYIKCFNYVTENYIEN